MKPIVLIASTAAGIIVGGIVLAGAFTVYASQSAPVRAVRKTGKTAAALKEETTTALKKASETKDGYQKRLKDELDAMKPKIEELKEKSAALAKDARAATQDQMAALENKRIEISDRLAAFSAKSGKAWTEMKSGMDAAVEDLKKSYDAAKEKFNQP